MRSRGSSLRSLTRTTVGRRPAAATAIVCASVSPAEILVPPLKDAVQGFGGSVGAKPACVLLRQREETDERRQVGRRRALRERLVRLIGEEDEPESPVAARERRDRVAPICE